LLTVIEINKRGKAVRLPLSGADFAVPANLFLIGTMNTADRSIALLDTAFRRRFGFIELLPDSTVFGAARAGDIPLQPWFAALNRRILEHAGRDARNLQIGHSFLLDQRGLPVTDFAAFARIVREDIIPSIADSIKPCSPVFTSPAR